MSELRQRLDSIARDGWLEAMIEEAPALGALSELLGRESVGLLILARVELIDLREGEEGELIIRYRSRDEIEEREIKALMERVIDGLLGALQRERQEIVLEEGTGEEMFGPLSRFLAALYGISLQALIFGENGAEIELEIGGTERLIRYAEFYPLLESSLFELRERVGER